MARAKEPTFGAINNMEATQEEQMISTLEKHHAKSSRIDAEKHPIGYSDEEVSSPTRGPEYAHRNIPAVDPSQIVWQEAMYWGVDEQGYELVR